MLWKLQYNAIFATTRVVNISENHCCPILDVFRDSEDEGYEYVVLPVLRDFNDPPFYAVVEVLELVRQTLEVL